MADLQRCLNDRTLAFDRSVGCPVTGCYRNLEGRCVTSAPITQRQMLAAADAVAKITAAIDLTADCIPAKVIEDRTQRFYNAKRNFFKEAGIAIGQLQTALHQGIDWITLVHSKALDA